jgi:hypothetical protein
MTEPRKRNGCDKPRQGDEPWTELPKSITVAALPENVMARMPGNHRIKVVGPAKDQRALVKRIEREAIGFSKVFLSKCCFRQLPQTLGQPDDSAQLLLEQHYCYAAFV